MQTVEPGGATDRGGDVELAVQQIAQALEQVGIVVDQQDPGQRRGHDDSR